MDHERRPICNVNQTVDLVAMEPVWRFLTQGSFNRSKILRTINYLLGRDRGQSVVIVVPDPGGSFFITILLDVPLTTPVLVSS